MIYLISRLDQHLEGGKPFFSTRTKVALAMVLVPAITVGAVWYAASKVSTAGVALVKGMGEVISKPLYLISSPFRSQKKVPEELKDRVLSEEEVKQFTLEVRNEIEMNSSKVYVAVTGLNSGRKKQNNSMVIEMEKGKTVNEVLQLCKRKWKLNKTESLQIFNNKLLLRLDTPLQELSRNKLGVVELQLSMLETFG